MPPPATSASACAEKQTVRLPPAADAQSYASTETADDAWVPSAALAAILERMTAAKARRSLATCASRRERPPRLPRRPTHPRPFWISTLNLFSAEGVRAASAWRRVAPTRHTEPPPPRRPDGKASRRPWRPVGELFRPFGDPPLHLQGPRARRKSASRIKGELEALKATAIAPHKDTAKDVADAVRDFEHQLAEDGDWDRERVATADAARAPENADRWVNDGA